MSNLLKSRQRAKGLPSHDALRTLGFGAGIANQITLPVEARDKHRAAMFLALGLVASNDWRLSPGWRDVSDALAETASAEFFGAAEKLNRVVGVEWRKQEFHGSEVLVAEWKQISSHGVLPRSLILRPGSGSNLRTCADRTASAGWRWPLLTWVVCSEEPGTADRKRYRRRRREPVRDA